MSRELSKFLGVKYTDAEYVVVKDAKIDNANEHAYFVSIKKTNFLVDGNEATEVIRKNAFKNVDRHEAILFTDKVRVLEESAFESCQDLRFVEFSSENAGKDNDGTVIEFSEIKDKNKIKPDIFLVQLNCFKNCPNLDTVVFPKVKTLKIENYAFSCCGKLRTIKIDSEKIDFSADAFFGVTELEFCVKRECEGLETFAREHGFNIVRT